MQQVTTARALGQYRRDLLNEGFADDIAIQMAVEAARLIIGDDGLSLGEMSE